MLSSDWSSDVCSSALLEKHFRQYELRGRGDADGRAIDLDLINLLEQLVGDGDAGGRDVVDDVEEVRADPDLADPALVLDLDHMAARLEEGENAGRVAGLAEDVEILGRSHDEIGRAHV